MSGNAEDRVLDRRRLAEICVTCVAYGKRHAAMAAGGVLRGRVLRRCTARGAARPQRWGGFLAAVVAALILNARLLPFGLAVADVFSGPRRCLLIGAHLIVDAPIAMVVQEPTPVAGARYSGSAAQRYSLRGSRLLRLAQSWAARLAILQPTGSNASTGSPSFFANSTTR